MSHLENPDLTAANLRQAFSAFPSGVTAVCGIVDGVPQGLVASSFTSVSLDPPLVSVCIARTSTTWRTARRARRLGVSVLASDQGDLCRQLAARSDTKFDGVDWTAPGGDAVFIEGATLWVDCTIDQELRAGDHDIVVLRVGAALSIPGTSPLVFHTSGFRQLAL